jgi:beta-galactosidase
VRPDAFLDWHAFWREHLTWYMAWTASEIRKHDDAHGIHVNPHGIFDTYRLYELPEWRDFLTSLGASIHPAWHFGILDRDQFALGVSATCDIIRGSAEPNPMWVSELQGGPNIYSVDRALGPTKEDIAQWVWTGIGAGAEKVIFWCLNWRRKGGEAGEWTMLNYQGEPSERLLEASEIAKTIRKEADFFAEATPVESNITIVLSQASMDIGLRKDRFETLIPGRKTRAHIQSSLGWYEALSERGIPSEFKEMADYDWEGARNAVAILANVIAIPEGLYTRIERFVENGNTLVLSGLSGYFNEHEVNVFQTKYGLEKVLGARAAEVKLVETAFDLSMSHPHLLLPAHMWKLVLEPTTGEVIGTHDRSPVAVSNRYGQGRAIWIAAQAGLGAWLGDNTALSGFIDYTLTDVQVPFRFREKTDNVVLRTLQNGGEYLTVVTNGKTKVQQVPLKAPNHLKGEVIYAGSQRQVDAANVTLGPRETVVIKWK